MCSASGQVAPHTSLRLQLGEVSGVASVTLRVLVSGQASNTLTLPVAPPELSFVRLFEPLTLPPDQRAADPCVLATPNEVTHAVLEVHGRSLGRVAAAVNASLLNVNTTEVLPCVLCDTGHTRFRCVAAVAFGPLYSLGVSVAGQAAGALPFSRSALVDTTPPQVRTARSTRGASGLVAVPRVLCAVRL